MRAIGIEEHHVARSRRASDELHFRHLAAVERRPLVADHSLVVESGGQFEAAVLRRRRIDADQRSDEQIGIAAPAGLLILMRLEAVAPGFLKLILSLNRMAGSPKRSETAQRSLSPSNRSRKPA